MEAIVLAGGRGTRLAGMVPDLPKPMAPIAGKPFLEYLLRRLMGQGIERAVLSVGHKAEVIQSYFGEDFEGLALVYAHETQPLGTGGAIRFALGEVLGPRVFVVNGDTCALVDLPAMQTQHGAAGDVLSIALCAVEDTARYGAVRFEGDRVAAFTEKGVSGQGYINSGTYLLQTDLFAAMDLPEAFSFESEVLTKQLPRLRPGAFLSKGAFIDIGVPEDYLRAQTELPRMLQAHVL